MMKTTKVLDPFQRQNASNSSANQNKKQKPKQKLKPKNQKTTALNPNPIKLIQTTHSNFSFQLMPFHCKKLVFNTLFHLKTSDGSFIWCRPSISSCVA